MTFEEWFKSRDTHAHTWPMRDQLKQVWDAAIAAEREACAKVCEEMRYVNPQPYHYAHAIRERGQKNSEKEKS